MQFRIDEMFSDAAGNPLNGSVFIGVQNETETARSVLALGITPRPTSHRCDGLPMFKRE